ncbi:hypothetical protein CTI12_AA436730 [Artemisia annua]|uniref:Reverse transcriptase domain-containing protein n=1 Tax=Artemisia annua TaxID=35608 RepID=A0A2U1LY73_ARTAN|nr:hypothetical protein CTI12_AA436730 [Artemisia annua]
MVGETSRKHPGPGIGAKYRVGRQGWYTKIENRPIYENKKISLEEMVNKHIEESSRKNEKFQEWMNEMKVDTERNLRNQSAAIKNLKTQIGQLAKNIQMKKSEVDLKECKHLSLQEENDEFKRDTDIGSKFCGVSYLQENNFAYERIPSQLPEKEPKPGEFLLPCTIGNLDMFALADLGASVNMISFSLFKKLNFINLKKTTSMVEMADMSRATPKGTVDNVLLRVNKFIFPGDFLNCENCNINHFEERVSYSKQAQDRHNQIMSRVMDGRNPILKTHYCNPIMMVSKGSERAWPSCNPFRYICDGGDNGELNEDKRAHLEWTCFHGIERRDIEFGNLIPTTLRLYRSNLSFDECQSNLPKEVYNEKVYAAETGECSKNIPPEEADQHFKINYTNPEKRPKGRDYSFDEWITRKFGTTNIDKKTRLKAFVEWMIDIYTDKSDKLEEYDDPFERSFEKFKSEFEREDIWEKCGRTFKKGRKFWHEVELEAMEVHECQLEGKRYDPPEVKVETFKVHKYTMDGVGSFISIDKTIDKQLPLGRMNGAKFKELIREEMHTQLGVQPVD